MPFCRNCGQWVDEGKMYCERCGTPIGGRGKDEGLTLILAVVCGIFGIMGIGHLYIGRFARGIGFLLLGFAPALMIFLSIMPLATGAWVPDEGGMGAFLAIVIVSGILWVVILVIQAFDAYRLVQEQDPGMFVR